MPATSSSTSNSLAFRQLLSTTSILERSPPPTNNHPHLPDHYYLAPLHPIHEQPPSLIPRLMDRHTATPSNAAHQRQSTSTGGGASAHGYARTSVQTSTSSSRPKVTRQQSASSLPATAAASAASAPLKARVNTSSIVNLSDVAQPALRRKTPSTLSMRSEATAPNNRSQSPLLAPSSSRSALGVGSGQISPDKPVRVAKVPPIRELPSSARLQRASSMRSNASPSHSNPATPSPAYPSGHPADPSAPNTRRASNASRARSPPSQLGSAFGSAIASLNSSASSSRRGSDDNRIRRPSATGPERPAVHVRSASIVSSVAEGNGRPPKPPPLESRHSSSPRIPPLESRQSSGPKAPPLESRHSGLAEVTPAEANETTRPDPRSHHAHHRQSSLLSPSTLTPDALPHSPPLEGTEEEYGEPSSNRSSPVRPTKPLDQISPHFRPSVFSAGQFPPASAPTSPIPRSNLPISPEKHGPRKSITKLPWLPGQVPPTHIPTPGSPNLRPVALPTLTPTISPKAEHRELQTYRLEENLHQLSLLHSHELAHAHEGVSPTTSPAVDASAQLSASPFSSPPITSSGSPGGSDEAMDVEKAKVNRKIADLEISNSSLLSINKALEKTKAMQRAEIVKLRRRLREQELPPLRRQSEDLDMLGLSAPHQQLSGDEDDEELADLTDPEIESRWDRLIEMVTVMRRAGEEAILTKKSGRAVIPWLDLDGEKAESVAGSTAAETEATEVTETEPSGTEADPETDTETELGMDTGTGTTRR